MIAVCRMHASVTNLLHGRHVALPRPGQWTPSSCHLPHFLTEALARMHFCTLPHSSEYLSACRELLSGAGGGAWSPAYVGLGREELARAYSDTARLWWESYSKCGGCGGQVSSTESWRQLHGGSRASA